ncbi:RNA polymerase sigma factor [Natranaerovirga hydrolytica]|nr:RNA polymerase sigma factor [Natranaerovirga hydrolytica]
MQEIDPIKFEKFYSTYKKEMYYTAFTILKDYYEAEDICHNAFVKTIDKLNKNMDINNTEMKYYLIKTVKNLSINKYKVNQKSIVTHTDFLRNRECENTLNPEAMILMQEDKIKFLEKLKKLKVNYAHILYLKYFLDLSNLEISKRLNISLGNTKTRLLRARKAYTNI